MEQWDKAAHQIDALPVAEQSRAEVRYVRARAAIALGDHAKALVVLDKLEKRLPLLREDIALRRAEAHLHAGSPEAAAQIFEANPSMRTLIKAALAWERAGQLQQGRKAINRAIHLARARDRTALEAMLVRARIAEAQGDANAAIADLRAVAARADDADLLRQAAAKLDQLDAKHHLTSQEHLDRADRIAQRGDTADALEALAQAEEAPGPPVTQARMLHARASARYKGRQNYDQAADLYEKAARIPGAHVPECLYFAAKAWTRADRNDRGLALYDELVRRFPRSLWAEAAMFYAARVHRFSARWATAAAAYSNYLKRYRQGAFRHDARYERSLCLLLAGQHRDARRSLTELAGSERNRLDARSMKYLAATAAFQDGDKHAAILAWREAARDEPLSWFALASTAQMRAAAVATPAAVPPASAAGSAAPLSVRLPPTAGLLRDIGLDDDAEEYLLEHEDALVKPFGTRNAQARCALYQTLGTAKRLHQVAQRYAPVQLVYAAPSRSTRWAWECLYPKPYAELVEQLEQSEELPHGLLHAIMRQESGFDPQARSHAGARGLMQLMPRTASKTAERLGVTVSQETIATPWLNLSLGAHYLSMLLRVFEQNVPLAVAAYNAGPIAVGSWLRRAGDLPLDLWVAQIPYRETRHYVWRVMGNFARYRYIARGDQGVPSVDLALPTGVTIPADAY